MKVNGLKEWPELSPGEPERTPWWPEWRWPANLSVHRRNNETHITIYKDESRSYKIVTTLELRESSTEFDKELVDRENLAKEKRRGVQEYFYGKAIPQPSIFGWTNGQSR